MLLRLDTLPDLGHQFRRGSVSVLPQHGFCYLVARAVNQLRLVLEHVPEFFGALLQPRLVIDLYGTVGKGYHSILSPAVNLRFYGRSFLAHYLLDFLGDGSGFYGELASAGSEKSSAALT